MIVYAFTHTDCVYESGSVTQSLHRTKAGAYKALKAHKLAEYKDWYELGQKFRKNYKFGKMARWSIRKQTILD